MNRRHIRDLLLFSLGVGLFFGLTMFWLITSGGRWAAEVSGKWGGLALNTLIMIGCVVQQYRRCLRRLSFWVVMSLFLCVHLLAFITVLKAIVEWRIAWWVVVTPAEVVTICTALFWMGYRPKQPKNSQ
jgi:hypothetical protein